MIGLKWESQYCCLCPLEDAAQPSLTQRTVDRWIVPEALCQAVNSVISKKERKKEKEKNCSKIDELRKNNKIDKIEEK